MRNPSLGLLAAVLGASTAASAAVVDIPAGSLGVSPIGTPAVGVSPSVAAPELPAAAVSPLLPGGAALPGAPAAIPELPPALPAQAQAAEGPSAARLDRLAAALFGGGRRETAAQASPARSALDQAGLAAGSLSTEGLGGDGASAAAGRIFDLSDEHPGVDVPEPPVQVLVTGRKDRERVLTIGGKDYTLKYDKQAWFYGVKNGETKWNGPLGPIKLHIVTRDAEDLGKLQRALIPVLMEDPDVASFKTMDPLFWSPVDGQRNPSGVMPNGRHQGAKAFTVYLPKDKAAVERVRGRLSEAVEAAGLRRYAPIRSENVDEMDSTNRVGLVRDHFRSAFLEDNEATTGFALNGELGGRIKSEFRKALKLGARQRFTSAELREIEKRTGLRMETLEYGFMRRGGRKVPTLMLLETPDLPSDDPTDNLANALLNVIFAGRGPAYAAESGAGRVFGDLSDRPALYALAKRYGLDPAAHGD